MRYSNPWTRDVINLALASAFVSFGGLVVLLAA